MNLKYYYYKMSLASWINLYEDHLVPRFLATNPNPNLINYLKENKHMIDWSNLSKNPNAIEILKENKHCIDWKNICLNPHPEAIELIENHHAYYLKLWQEKGRRIPYDMVLSWKNLSKNPHAIDFLKKNPVYTYWAFQEPPYHPNQDDYDYESEYLKNLRPDNEISWESLSENPKAIKLLKKNHDKIVWTALSKNTSKRAIKLLRENPKKIYWTNASQNPRAIDLIEENLNKVDWKQMSKNPKALHLFDENYYSCLFEVDWCYLSANPSALHLLEQYRTKIDYRWLCKNPNAAFYLEENIEDQFDKLDWNWLSENPCIFDE